MTTRYATLAYGPDEVVFRRAAMLVVSLAAHAPAPAEFVVLTDDPGRFDLLGTAVRTETFTAAELAGWRGAHRFSLREKIEAARRLVPSQGGLVMLDADTLAIEPLGPMIAALQNGSLFMHRREYALGSSRRAGNRRLWNDLKGRTFDGWEFQPTDGMWNSGVIALTQRDAALLDSALTLYDALGAAGLRHFMIEQLVVGAVFERTGRLLPADRYFAHYWGNKPGFDQEIARRVADIRRSGSTVSQAADAYRHAPIDLPLDARPGPFEKLSRWFAR